MLSFTSLGIVAVEHKEDLVVVSRARSLCDGNLSLFTPSANDLVVVFVVVDGDGVVDDVADLSEHCITLVLLLSTDCLQQCVLRFLLCLLSDEVFAGIGFILLLALSDLLLDHVQ